MTRHASLLLKMALALAVGVAGGSVGLSYWMRPAPAAVVVPERQPHPLTALFDLDPPLVLVQPASSQGLENLFRRDPEGLHLLPPDQSLLPVSVVRFPSDLAELPNELRKAVFIRTLLPLVVRENERIETARGWLLDLQSRLRRGLGTDEGDQAVVAMLADEVLPEGASQRGILAVQVDALLAHLGPIPPSLVLAQAALESGWGTSRFAQQANNLFGVWVKAGYGLTPLERVEGATHEVAYYPSLAASVASYMRNLNRHPSYEPLRRLRRDIEAQGRLPKGVELAQGLEHYSARGPQYIDEIESIIVRNRLDRLYQQPLRWRAPEEVRANTVQVDGQKARWGWWDRLLAAVGGSP